MLPHRLSFRSGKVPVIIAFGGRGWQDADSRRVSGKIEVMESGNLSLFAGSELEPESETSERKQSWNEEGLKALAAFANTRGGTLWIGIVDDGKTVGWPGDGHEQEMISNQISDKLQCLPIAMTVQTRDGLPLLVIRMVRAASPIAIRGRYYRRVGNSTRRFPDGELPRFLPVALRHDGPGFGKATTNAF